MLDDERNDIFIHLDKKMGEMTDWILSLSDQVTSANIYYIKRKRVFWGDYSFTEVIIDLLSKAVSTYDYSYYHLLTGTSLPIKTQDEIHEFFDNDIRQLLYFHINKEIHKTIQDRAKAYYPFINKTHFRNNWALKLLSICIGKMEIIMGINRLRNSEFNPVYNGWGWFSIPNDFAHYAITKQEAIKSAFQYTLASDEVWIQTVAMHSEFSDRIYGYNGKDDPIDASKHFQDWKRGKPYVFQKEDYDLLMKDNRCFFARKFDENVDKEIIDMIFITIKKTI